MTYVPVVYEYVLASSPNLPSHRDMDVRTYVHVKHLFLAHPAVAKYTASLSRAIRA